jgi:1,4-dihydroxy-2-naphthoate octaprenyltransferase
MNGLAVHKKQKASELDPYLKQMALTTMLYVLTFGIGNLL